MLYEILSSNVVDYFKALEARLPYYPVDVIKVGDLDRRQRILLGDHGCTLMLILDATGLYYAVTFPEGTVKRECLPRILSGRYLIKLPGGLELGEIIPCGKFSILGFPPDAEI